MPSLLAEGAFCNGKRILLLLPTSRYLCSIRRLFTSSLTEESKQLEEDIEAVKQKVDDPMMCEKVRLFIYAPPEIQQFYKEEACKFIKFTDKIRLTRRLLVAEEMDLIAIVLRNSEHPILSRPQMYRVAKSWEKYRQYLKHKKELDDPDDDEGPADEEAWLFEDLHLLGKLYSRLRDREQLISLIYEVGLFPTRPDFELTTSTTLGKHSRSIERYNHDILFPTRPGL